MRYFRHISILLLLTISTVAFAQIKAMDDMPPGKLKRFGLQAYKFNDYISTVDYLEQYYQGDSENAKVNEALAMSYYKTRNYEQAEKLLKVVLESDEDNAEILYTYAQTLKANGKYEESIGVLRDFRKASKNVGSLEDLRKQSIYDIKGSEAATYYIDTVPLNVELTHLNNSINKVHMELSPLYLNDSTMMFSSLRTDTSIVRNLNDTTPQPVRKFYIAAKVDSTWKYLAEMPGPFNSDGVNTGNGCYSPNGMRFYFTRCEPNIKGEIICAIYVSKRAGKKWTEPEMLSSKINNPKYSSTQPTIGIETRPDRPDREILYFVSNNDKDGKGGYDIWYSIYEPNADVYTEARNLGGRINTRGDEMTPFYDIESNTLYFSSTGHAGLGGLDVFKATGQRNKLSKPENVGYPINSGADDLYYITNKDNKKGFFVSNRPGSVTMKNKTCCDDIYEYEYRNKVEILLAGKFLEFEGDFDPDTLKKMSGEGLAGIDSADVSLFLVDDEDGSLIPMKTIKTTLEGSYDFELEGGKKYKVYLSKDGVFGKELEINTTQFTASTTINKTTISTIIPDKPMVLENIYYEFNSARLTENAKNSIDTTLLLILNDNPNMIIELSSHTDSKGSDSYNMTLSRNRAKSVVSYLITKGISTKRLVAKGYGETQPVAPNENPDGSDNPEGRAKNRRTEFKVLGKLEVEDDE